MHFSPGGPGHFVHGADSLTLVLSNCPLFSPLFFPFGLKGYTFVRTVIVAIFPVDSLLSLFTWRCLQMTKAEYFGLRANLLNLLITAKDNG